MSDFNLIDIVDLLGKAQDSGIKISYDENDLVVKVNKEQKIDSTLLKVLKDNKQHLITYFRQYHQRTAAVTGTAIAAASGRAAETAIPLSFSQERLWIIDQLEGSVQYHLSAALRMEGTLDPTALEKALREIVNRHEILRTVIRTNEDTGRPSQYVMEKDQWQLTVTDGARCLNDNAALQDVLKKYIAIPFDLANDHLLRAQLIVLKKDIHILALTLHHIVSDGWSTGILVSELQELYDAYANGRTPQLAPLEIQYADYALWQRKQLGSTGLQQQLDHWKQQLSGVAPLELPLDYPRPAVQSSRGATIDFTVEHTLAGKLKQLSRQEDVTLFMTLLAAFKVLLYRYSGQDDICVGSPVSGRTRAEMETLIGLFVNTLALRSDLSDHPTFRALLQQIKQTTLSAYDHQEIPLEKVIETVVKGRDPGRSPLFQVVFALQNMPASKADAPGKLRLSEEKIIAENAKFDLTLIMEETNDGLKGSVEYCSDLFSAATAEALIVHFKELLSSIVATPEARIDHLSLLNSAAEQQLLETFNNTRADFPLDKTVLDLFREQVAARPEAVALNSAEGALSYRVLDERSSRLAHYLQQQGVAAGSFVPVCLERSNDLVVAMLAIIKTGAAYVPVDPSYPSARIRFMLEDTGASIIVCNEVIAAGVGEKIRPVIPAQEQAAIDRCPATAPAVTPTSDKLAYVIYTSGTTGKPKGVMIEHRGLANLVHWHNQAFRVTADSRATAVSGIGFDAFGWEVWPYLSTGASVFLVDDDTRIFIPALVALHVKEQITHAFISTALVPAFIQAGAGKIQDLQYLLTGGDKLPATNVAQLPYKLVNNYGPTENSVVTTSYELLPVNAAVAPPIGRPVSNTRIYVLSPAGAICPVGVAGEICIAGASLAKGYLNLPVLTEEKFTVRATGERIYHTGDMGRWRADGTIEYLGRIDEQVKIRGYRIEPGEIENVLSSCKGVKQSLVLAKADVAGHKRLVAYVAADDTFDKDAALAEIKSRLPEYMVPAVITVLEQLPLTANGKIDKNALPEPSLESTATASYVAPRNTTEEVLVAVWQELLGVQQIGIYDNFFELGGDSIITIQAVGRIRRAGYELQPRDLFVHQHIAALAAHIQAHAGRAVTGEQGTLTGASGLLPIQQWFLNIDTAAVNHFNQSVLLGIDKKVALDVLTPAIRQLVNYHDALRFVYHRKENLWQQEYGAYEGGLEVADLRSVAPEQLPAAITATADRYQASLDIKGTLVKVVLILTPETEAANRLFIVVHHLAVDAVSWRILLEDLQQLLQGQQLEKKSSSYRQWQQALVNYGESQRGLSQVPYWEKVVQQSLKLKTDKTFTGDVTVSDIGNHTAQLSTDITRQLLKDTSKAYHTEINDMLLTALTLTLSAWNNNAAVIVGLEGHGREDINKSIDTSRTVGWFTNLFPVLLETGGSRHAGDALKAVKEQLRSIPDKGLGYGVLKYLNKIPALQGVNPWNVVFNYLGQSDNLKDEAGLFSGASESSGADTAPGFPLQELLTVTGLVREGQLHLDWNYSTQHFEAATIAQLAQDYLIQLEQLVAHCVAVQTPVFTPSDYGLNAWVSNEELDSFLDALHNGVPRRSQVDSLYRLSGLQEGMLFHSLYAAEGGTYTEQMTVDIDDLQVDAFVKSWDLLLEKHTILRTAFYYDRFSIPVQCVYKHLKLPVEILDYTAFDGEEQNRLYKELLAADLRRGFDFTTAPLMRLTLVRLHENDYRMLWTSHHILLDGWSLPILVEGLLSGYEALLTGSALPSLKEDRFEEYIQYLDRQDKEEAEHYWKQYLSGLNEASLLPFIGNTTARTKGVGAYNNRKLVLDAAFTQQLSRFTQRNHITVNTLMQGVWAYLLHAYTGHSNVAYGITVSGRPDSLTSAEKGVGLYINTLPLHTAVDESSNIIDWLKQIQAGQLHSREHQYNNLQEVQQWAGVNGDLFDSSITFQNYPVNEVVNAREWQLKVKHVETHPHTNYPLTIIISISTETSLVFAYNTALLDDHYLEAITGHFKQVLQQIATGIAETIQDIELLTSAEKQQLLNTATVAYPAHTTLIDIFEQQADRVPEQTAVRCEELVLTYSQLDKRATQLAHYLRGKGVTTGSLVPLYLERSADILVALLGILKAGGAYVPIDPDFPAERVSYMLADTEATVIVTNRNCAGKLPLTGQQIITLDGDAAVLDTMPATRIAREWIHGQPVYVIYTSGSTGNPKGVIVTHQNLMDYVYGLKHALPLEESRSFGLMSSIATDLGNTVVFGALATGGALHVFTKDAVNDAERIAAYFAAHPVDCIKIVPSHWKALSLPGNLLLPRKLLIFGGEALDAGVIATIRASGNNCTVVNHYGPTETTVGKLIHIVQPEGIYEQQVPIGKPFSNTRIYVVSPAGKLSPVGVPGELYIGGDGVATGYLHQESLTSEKFVADRFLPGVSSRLYRTGDLVKYLPDGNILFLGRADDQVKIRGYRVELGEIENALVKSGLTEQAVVLAKPDRNGDKRLVAYILRGSDTDKDALQAYVKNELPDHMHPALWSIVDSFPLMANGKVDRKALPDPDETIEAQQGYVAPETAVEQKLAAIWSVLLEVEEVGRHDDFFALGGHSLLAIRLISAIRKQMEAEVTIGDVFDYPTVAALAAQLTQRAPQPSAPAMVRMERPARIPLSFSQERLWFIDRMEGSVHYHVPAVLRLKGSLDTVALATALKTIVERHEALRTVIEHDGAQTWQRVLQANDWQLQIIAGTAFMAEAALQDYIARLVITPFDLANDYMLRAHLIARQHDEYVLVVTLHHIASDAWSTGIIVTELIELYEAYATGRTPSLPELGIQYADFAIWQREYLSGSVLQDKLTYWKNKLSGTATLQLPTDFPRPAVQSTRGSMHSFRLDRELSAALQALSQQQGTTLFMTLLAAFKVLLYRYSGQEDICVGVPIAGRTRQETEGLIGFFINTLALRSDLGNGPSFTTLLQQVKQTTLGAYEQQEVPFEQVVDAVVRERDISRTPLFQVMFVLQNAPEEATLKLGDLALSQQESAHTTSRFDLSWSVIEGADGLMGSIEYCLDLFRESTIQRMVAHFEQLLRAIVRTPGITIDELTLVTSDETEQLLHAFNQTAVAYPAEDTILSLFATQVAMRPNSTALASATATCTYKTLDERSSQLAHYLLGQGVKAGDRVPVCLERAPEIVMAMLAIMKAGAAYVPVDPAYPLDRIRYMLSDCAATVMITDDQCYNGLPEMDHLTIVRLDVDREAIIRYKPTAVLPEVASGHVAYLIYTSGSTGQPKGVMVPHRGLSNLIHWHLAAFRVNAHSRATAVSGVGFDAFGWEVWPYLAAGAYVYLPDNDTRVLMPSLIALHRQQGFTHAFISTAQVQEFIRAAADKILPLQYLLTGGDQLPATDISGLSYKIINNYGPTENSVVATWYELSAADKDRAPVIGRPVSNTSVYILNRREKLCPAGIAGEICLAGNSLALGYFGRPDLTQEKFVPDPFHTGSWMYKTGDLGRWLPDGTIEYLGRLDEQVKVRGYRIELGEIESALAASGQVQQAVVMARRDHEGNRQLVAYVVPAGDYQKADTVAFLKTRLPDYMVPALWVTLDKLPLTANGKIDKNALPAPDMNSILANAYVAPRNATEETLAEIWQEVLGRQRTGIHDNFFESGGNSLQVVRLIALIRSRLQAEVPIRTVFANPTVAQLATWLSTAEGSQPAAPALTVQTRGQCIPLSFSQERLWFIHQLEGSVQYHIPQLLHLNGDLNIPALERSLQTLINRHEVLRSVMQEEDGVVYQQIQPTDSWKLNVIDNADGYTDEAGREAYLGALVRAPFDLSRDHLLRAHLLRLGHNKHLLVLVIHHIAADGWSMGIATREVMALYNTYAGGEETQLPELPLQYADFAIWQRAQLSAEVLDRKLAWWKNKMEDVAPLELPTDFTPLSTISMKGARIGVSLPPSLGRQLQQLALQQDATLYMVLLSAFKVLLHRYSGQDDISVGTSAAGRTQQETQNLIGFFINTLALRSDLGNNPAFTDLLQQVKQTTLDAFDHQEVPFEKIVEAVVKDRDPNRRPLFQVMFVMDNTPSSPDFSLHNLTLAPEEITHTTARFNIILSMTEDSEGGLHAAVEYAMDLFREDTIRRMLAHFETLLQAVVAAPQEKIDQLALLTGKEQQQQLAALDQTVNYPRQQTFLHWFEAAARHNPGSTALAFEGQLLTWKALEQRSALLAHYLRSKGVGADVLVPVCVDRSLDMMVAVMGVLRAGGAYVPVEPDFPAERIKYMLQDTRATVMVSLGQHRDIIPPVEGLEVIFLDEQQDIINGYTTTGRLELPAPSSIAYVIYTSGSTGTPKGVKVTHHNLADYITGLRAHLPVDECHSFGLLSSIATDLGNTVLFAALSIGATLHLFSKDTINDARKVLSYFETHEIDCIKIVPSHWKALSEPEQLLLPEKLLIFGGEALEYSVVEAIRAANAACVVVNHYGPTETTIGKLLHIVNAHTEYGAYIPVGKPFSNTRAYVLNPERQLCPVGVPGELYIGGEGVAAGYLHNEALTADKFVADPFTGNPLARLYRTGDRVRLLPDGNILFLGRIDDQVKIRGYRVEPGEIGRVLEQCPGVVQAVVIAREDNTGNKRLLGYVVPATDFDVEEVLNLLRAQLPDYMVPAAITPLDTFPMLANGKIDKRALPDPEKAQMDTTAFAAPVTAVQLGLAAIWERLLEVEQVGLHDDFFALGGHSLLAIRVISAIRKQLKLEVTIGDVFDHPTIGGLATLLESRKGQVQTPDLLRKERPANIPLSFSQERLWFIDQVEGSLHYHLPTVLRLKGPLDSEALARAAQAIINRHEVLRTVIASGDGQSWQRILPEDRWRMEIYEEPSFRKDITGLHAFVEELITKPFDLSADHMLRVQLIVLGKDEHILVATLHHIASDGWSTGVLVKELAAFYDAYAAGREPELAPLELQYADYAIWQREHLSGEMLAKQLGYWEQKLSGVAALQLPLDYPRTAVQSNRGATTTFMLDRDLSDQLHALAKQEGATIFMTLLAAFQVLLYRYSGQDDICVGSPIAGRTRQELEGLIGFFINTLSLRADMSGNPAFTALLQQVKQTTLDAYAHQEVPFEKIVEVVAKDRDLSRNPVFQVALVLQNLPDVPELKLGELVMTEEGAEHTTAKLDLTVLFREGPEGLGASVEYCADLFLASTIERMMSQFKQLLRAIVNAPQTPVAALPLLDAADEKMLLEDFNNTAVAYPADQTIVQLFVAQARQRSNEVAVLFKEEVITYRELDEWSDRLALYLQQQGVKEEMMVPVCIPRSPEMMVAILAILKAGGAYVPLDPDYPAERIAFMLKESNSHISLTVSPYISRLAEERPEMTHLCIGELYKILPAYREGAVQNKLEAGSLAYVMYTSGSTGKPKGVLVTHRNVTSLVMQPNYVSLQPTDAILSAGSLSFDATTFEYWGALLNGGRLVLSPENNLLDTEVLKQELYQKQVTVLFITTGWFNQLVDTDVSVFAHLHAILTGGEKMSEKHVVRFRTAYPEIKISNIYGPTENTTFSLSYPIRERGLTVNTPIGMPLNNRTAYILDAALQLVPVGVAGELYVGGDGVARGYLNREELTAERFIAHPYGKKPGDRLYKTGDMARWRTDGSVEYLGRQDDQVKVRGFRIELGEVESVLLQYPQVSQTVVIAKAGENGNKRLLGYIVPEGDFEREKLVAWLRERLPDYMVPSYLIPLEKLPMTANGKVDKKALPDPDTIIVSGGNYVAPATPTEKALAAFWKEQLELEKVGIYDNYFEAGGNSLLAIHLIAVIRKQLAGEISISDIFDYPTIAELANVLEQRAMAKVNAAGIVGGFNGNQHILPLNNGSQASPLFFLPGGNGICEGYTVLGAALEDVGALYGLQMMGIFAGEKPLDNVPAIATQNIAWMKSVQPAGPYRLIGHSLGGQVAYEMTRQLEQNGEKVEALFILDTHVAPKRSVLDNDMLYNSLLEAFEVYKIAVKPYPEWVKALKPAIAELEPKDVIPFVLEYLKEHVQEEKEHLGFVMRMFDMATHSLFMEYTVSGLADTALTVIRAEARSIADTDDSLGWAPFATRSAALMAPGDHISMTKETGAATVATHIKTQLNHI